MRAVNLIPADDRKTVRLNAGGAPGVPAKTPILSYVIVGGLIGILAMVALAVTTGNKVGEREAEVAQLETELAAATARAEGLKAFSEFEARQQARQVTVQSLADSRFDWERVLRELAIVIPSDVWLVQMTGAAGSDDASITGPSLVITGCAEGHSGVARFVQALEDIDGVTRVGVSSSALPDAVDTASGTPGGTEECRTRNFIAKFELTVAFDEVATAGATEVPGVPEGAAPAPAAPETQTADSQTPVSVGAVR